MMLTTLARVKTLLGLQTTTNDEIIRTLIQMASGMIETFLDRKVRVQQYTDYFDVVINQRKFWLSAYPIQPVLVPGGVAAQQIQAFYDIKRLFDPTITAEDFNNYGVKLETGRVSWEWPLNINRDTWEQSLKIIWTGGMAYTLDRVVGTLGAVSGNPTAALPMTGNLSGAVVTLQAINQAQGTVTLQVTGGDSPVIAGETFADSAGNSLVLASITTDCLCDLYPQIVGACNMQAQFMFQRKDELGLNSKSTEGGSITTSQPMELIDLVKRAIRQERRYARDM